MTKSFSNYADNSNMIRFMLILFMLTGCAKGDPGDLPLVFLIAGQSNSVSPAQDHSPYYSQTGLVTVSDVYHGGGLRIPTLEEPMDGSISWIYLGDMIGKPVTFINVGQGNTSTTDWRETLHTRITNALKTQRVTAVLWVQGESDINEGIPEKETYENLKWVIEESRRTQYGLIWFVALNSMKTNPRDNSVRRAEQRIINERIAQQGPDTDTIRETPEFMELSGAEFVGDGLREHARLWFNVLQLSLSL